MPQANSWYLGANIPVSRGCSCRSLGGFGVYGEIIADVAAAFGYKGFDIHIEHPTGIVSTPVITAQHRLACRRDIFASAWQHSARSCAGVAW